MSEYLFIDGLFEHEYTIKRSKFITTILGEVGEAEATAFVSGIKKKYPDATHNCYAYIADEIGNIARFSDDGEPSGTAGQPILEVLKKHNLKKTAVVVTRYFGGIKLGAGGLVGAYTKAVSEGLAKAAVSVKKLADKLLVTCGYGQYNMIENILSNPNVRLSSAVWGDKVAATIFAVQDIAENVKAELFKATKGDIQIETQGNEYVAF